MVGALAARKEALQARLAEKVEELRKICFHEAVRIHIVCMRIASCSFCELFKKLGIVKPFLQSLHETVKCSLVVIIILFFLIITSSTSIIVIF